MSASSFVTNFYVILIFSIQGFAHTGHSVASPQSFHLCPQFSSIDVSVSSRHQSRRSAGVQPSAVPQEPNARRE